MEKETEINAGGINGLGEALVNTNSQEFLALQQAIKAHYNSSSEEERIENGLLSVRFQMESYLSSDTQSEMILAGAFMEKLLAVVKVKKKRFSEYIDYEYSNLIALIKGRRKINPDLAIKLGQIFNIEPVLWLQIESKNELLRAVEKEPKASYEFSLSELLKAG